MASTATDSPGRETREDLHRRLTGADIPLADRQNRGPGEDLTPPRERAANEGRAPRTKAQIFSQMDPQEWACRSQEHSWPQLPPGATKLPRGMRFSAAGAGAIRQEDDCLHDCGRYRETVYDRHFAVVSRTYGTRPGKRHTVIHRDEAMSKAEMREDVLSTSKKLIRQVVKDTTAAAKAAAKTGTQS